MNFGALNGGAIWLVAGLLLGAQELILPGYFLLWIGLAAIGTGLLTTALPIGQTWQIAAFAALAVGLIAVAALRRRSVPDTVNAPNAGLIGLTCYAIGFNAGEGRVRLRDGTWQARTANGSTPDLDEPLRVISLDGTTLVVSRGVEP
jgi:membrane protein implicated in regulation of membrane protease activity